MRFISLGMLSSLILFLVSSSVARAACEDDANRSNPNNWCCSYHTIDPPPFEVESHQQCISSGVQFFQVRFPGCTVVIYPDELRTQPFFGGRTNFYTNYYLHWLNCGFAGTVTAVAVYRVDCPSDKKWNSTTQQCEEESCPIGSLQPLNDNCALSLEAGNGVDGAGACPGLTPEMNQQKQCLANKITSLGISYPGPTSTTRTGPYQAHLREIWEKLRELKKLEDPAVIQACASRKAEIEAHKLSHGLTDRPAASNSRHESGNAVDIGNDVARELINRVTTDTSDVQDYVNSPFSNPPACNLQWGGRFQQNNWIHFQLP